MNEEPTGESVESLRRSFSYGSRSNLNFKFLKATSDEDAGAMFETLLRQLGEAYDTGDIAPLIATAIEAQMAGYAPSEDADPPREDDHPAPFTPLSKPLSESRLGLLTTSGHFVTGDDPEPFGVKDMSQDEAISRIFEFLREKPTLSEIPSATPTADITVRHGGYDITSVEKDLNVAFPADRLRELKAEGAIGSLASTYFSFPGATAQGRLRKELPAWVERIHEEQVDVMLLVPV